MKRLLAALPFALVALASGCGSSDAGGNVNKADLPGTALLFVDPETTKQQDDILHDVEICLSDL